MYDATLHPEIGDSYVLRDDLNALRKELYTYTFYLPRTLETAMALEMMRTLKLDVQFIAPMYAQTEVSDILRMNHRELSWEDRNTINTIKSLARELILATDRAGLHYQTFVIRVAVMLAVHSVTGPSTPIPLA